MMRDEGGQHDEPGYQERIAVSSFGSNESRQPDRARRSGNILDRYNTHQTPVLEHLLHHAGSLIPPAARRRRRDDSQMVERLPSGVSGQRQQQRGESDPWSLRSDRSLLNFLDQRVSAACIMARV
jgi:hypothetical protein